MVKQRSLKTLALDGGTLPFHLVNTVYAWRGENLHEYLNNYTDVLDWCAKVGLLKNEQIKSLRKQAASKPATAQKAFREIIETRLLLYHFFSAVAANNASARDQWLVPFNKRVLEALQHFTWVPSKSGFQFLPQPEPSLLLPLWLVMKAAHDLLLRAELKQIKECARCGWIFLDTTKNNTRRWCSPQTCGSVEKSKRYYRKKAASVKA